VTVTKQVKSAPLRRYPEAGAGVVSISGGSNDQGDLSDLSHARGAIAPSFAQTTAANLIGSCVENGTEVDGKPYDGSGTLDITMDKSGALELKWDGGKYVGIGQLQGNTLAIASIAEGKLVILLMDVKPDGSEGNWWRRTDAGNKGTETWKKK
jgi:hypothetical protein